MPSLTPKERCLLERTIAEEFGRLGGPTLAGRSSVRDRLSGVRRPWGLFFIPPNHSAKLAAAYRQPGGNGGDSRLSIAAVFLRAVGGLGHWVRAGSLKCLRAVLFQIGDPGMVRCTEYIESRLGQYDSAQRRNRACSQVLRRSPPGGSRDLLSRIAPSVGAAFESVVPGPGPRIAILAGGWSLISLSPGECSVAGREKRHPENLVPGVRSTRLVGGVAGGGAGTPGRSALP